MARRFYDPQVRPINSGGATYPGGKLYFYDLTTGDPCTVYSAYTPQNSSTSLGSVVTADGNGIFPEIYLGGSQNLGYRVILKTSASVIVYDYDVYNKPDGVTTGEITTGKIATGAVTTAKIADGAVTQIKIADGVINGGTGAGVKIAASTITANNLASDCVTTAKILNSNVTGAKLADGIITGGAAGTGVKLAASTITADNLASNCVTTAKIADSTGAADGVTTAKLATNAVTTAKITDANVTTAKLAAATYNKLPFAGRVAAAGTWASAAPATVAPGTPFTWTVSRSAGPSYAYTITHNLGHTNYAVTFSAAATLTYYNAFVTSVNANDFVVSFINDGGTYISFDFNFILVSQ